MWIFNLYNLQLLLLKKDKIMINFNEITITMLQIEYNNDDIELTRITRELTPDQYINMTRQDTLKCLKLLGYNSRSFSNFTRCGYTVTKIVTNNPDKTKTIRRSFTFEYK